MSGLWTLWVIYCIVTAADFFYVQPFRRRRAAEVGRLHKPGSLSFGLRVALPVVTVFLLVRTFALNVYHIPTSSMEPNISEGTVIFVNRLAYGLRSPLTGSTWITRADPSPGEVFLFRYPREPRTTFVKRVLGVPGDRIRVDGDAIFVNDRLLNPASTSGSDPNQVQLGESQYLLKDDPLIRSDVHLDLVVPADHYFALGDNINHSEDSRVWGLVSSRHLIGRVVL